MKTYQQLIDFAEAQKTQIIEESQKPQPGIYSLWLVDNGKPEPQIIRRQWHEEIAGRAICFGSIPLTDKTFKILIRWEKEKLHDNTCDAIYKTRACKYALEVMDSEENPSYMLSVQAALNKYPETNKQDLETELNLYI